MENSRLAGAKHRLAVAKKVTAAAAAVAFGVTFVALRDGRAASSSSNTKAQAATTSKASTSAASKTVTQTQMQTQSSLLGSSNIGSASGAAPSVSSSTS